MQTVCFIARWHVVFIDVEILSEEW
jgi:hypothetical protein